jgi:hypothetical protein
MNAFDWMMPHLDKDGAPTRYRFSFRESCLADDLRELAKRIDKGEIVIHSVQTGQRVTKDDWTRTTLTLELGGVHWDPKP